MKKVCILGSTGSIGINSLEVIEKFPDKFEVSSLSTNGNIELLEKQIEKFSPKVVAVCNETKAKELREKLNSKCEVLSGEVSLTQIARDDNYDILLTALVGFSGLAPTIEGIMRGKRIALANKETLVVAGELIYKLVEQYDSEIIPVDSEHSAIFQCLVGENKADINKIILTASGGPFREKKFEKLKSVTVEEALDHPNWDMGNKITIDSATMMNKGLEVIEAFWLFSLPKDKIEVVIHPQSIIHSMVEFRDGSIKAQLSEPDMKLPIQYALSFPERLNYDHTNTSFKKISQLTFQEPDIKKFQCLKLAYDALTDGGTAPCILNAANEVAVDMFLKGEIGFLEIPAIIEDALNRRAIVSSPDIETIFDCDNQTRDLIKSLAN